VKETIPSCCSLREKILVGAGGVGRLLPATVVGGAGAEDAAVEKIAGRG
jgi:hypothetical protein